ncbi:MAG: VWA domain-containing protein [Roseburia sp.]|nr:VWA domain-containing protein [Roseburia sp.]
MTKKWIWLCFLILYTIIPQAANAEEIVSQKEPFEIIFVIDGSGSMKANDSSKIALDMVQAFVDTLQTEEIRAGYVAYNDSIISYAEPESIKDAGKREELKGKISSIEYSGDTDIGLGVSYAYQLFSKEENARRVMVLISDGETDLPENGGRTVEQSNQELALCVRECRENQVQAYTVAFGQYQGNQEALENIAKETGAKSYSAQSPENLIEVLYGIFQDNLLYRIQQFSSGTYAGGSQEIRCVLDAPYLDEINILLLSSAGSVGDTVARYGETEIALANLSHYAVGKIGADKIDNSIKELVVQTATTQEQDLQTYVISYRGLMPVLEMEPKAKRNQELKYKVCFKDRNGNLVADRAFYEKFSWELVCDDPDSGEESIKITEVKALDDGLSGSIQFSASGTYRLNGTLSDEFGDYKFQAQAEVENTVPSGSIPEEEYTVLERERIICLDDYFTDEDGDKLSYTLPEGQTEGAGISLEGNLLTLMPREKGNHLIMIQVSDGEDVIQYVYRMEVIPLWKAYWWAVMLALAALAVIVWLLTHKPKPELERLAEEKKQNRFCGKLDAYFALQPQDEEEIPPLSFQMNKIKDSRVSLGDLFGLYPEQAEALQLQKIFLIADENRNMILYHTSMAGVMVGNGIACKQIQYRISFGDIIYITSPDGRYDLEIHYIAVLQ